MLRSSVSTVDNIELSDLQCLSCFVKQMQVCFHPFQIAQHQFPGNKNFGKHLKYECISMLILKFQYCREICFYKLNVHLYL